MPEPVPCIFPHHRFSSLTASSASWNSNLCQNMGYCHCAKSTIPSSYAVPSEILWQAFSAASWTIDIACCCWCHQCASFREWHQCIWPTTLDLCDAGIWLYSRPPSFSSSLAQPCLPSLAAQRSRALRITSLSGEARINSSYLQGPSYQQGSSNPQSSSYPPGSSYARHTNLDAYAIC